MKPFCLLVLAFGLAAAVPTVDDQAVKEIRENGKTTVVLHFKGEQNTHVLAKYHEEHRPFERSVHPDILRDMLIAHSEKSQAKTLEFFAKRQQAKASGSNIFHLWIANKIVVHDADMDLIEELKKNDEISHIEASREMQLIDSVMEREDKTTDSPHLIDGSDDRFFFPRNPNKTEWGIERVGAPTVWDAKTTNVTGTGVVVGIVDTGVYRKHETLKDNYRKEFGFYDAVGGGVRKKSYDDQGHGTHCAGTVLGTKGIGVAPGAKWIACKGLNALGSGTQAGLAACLQFMYCPFEGSDTKNCSRDMAPHVVSNSWGSNKGGSTMYDGVIESLIASNIVVVFAVGNSGSKCETIGSPGDNKEVIGVGATDINNVVASFSSRGPSVQGYMKPEISAPGKDILSAYWWYPTQYRTLSGTSMATPHIAGIAALMKSADPTLTHYQIKDLLQRGANGTKATGQTCGAGDNSRTDNDRPNYQVGHGLAYAPVGIEEIRRSKQ